MSWLAMFAQLGNNEALAKEEQRIAAKRAINEQRKQRILNPRIRTIGIDVSALDQQVIEKQNKLEMLKEEARMEKLVALETERVLAASAEEEKMMRKFQMDEMKKSWNEEIHQRRLEERYDIHFDTCKEVLAYTYRNRRGDLLVPAERHPA